MTLMNMLWARREAARTLALCAGLVFAVQASATAGPLRERWQQRSADFAGASSDAGLSNEEGAWADRRGGLQLPPGTRLLRDVAYGSNPLQRMDVYLPAGVRDAPAILLVHGGGWSRGDKAHARLVQHKAAHWLAQGVVVVSVNYRLLPGAGPLQQAQDVAGALAAAQKQAASWGGDALRFVLMGHSAGAHLAALLAASPDLLRAAGAHPVRGTVALDSAAFDVEQIMQARHLRLYDQAFGADPASWRRVSPLHQLQPGAAPLLGVCSTRRGAACEQAQNFAARARTLGVRVEVLAQDLSHGEINEKLGLPGPYTEAVEAFLHSLGGWRVR